MRLVEQINDIDCGIAVAAMISGYSYRIAMRADLYPWSNVGLSVPQMLDLLTRLTRNEFKVLRKSVCLNRLRSLPIGAILIRPDKKTFGHWIASDGIHIYDPERRTPIKIENYERSTWECIRVLTASSPSATPTESAA